MGATLVLYGPDRKHGAHVRKSMRTYRWYIVESIQDEKGRWVKRERATGCCIGERAEAEKMLGAHLISGSDPRPSGPRDPAELQIDVCLSIYMQEHGTHTAAPDRIGYAEPPLRAFWSGRMVGDITGNTCRAYVRQRKASLATARRELGVLRTAVRHCEREGYLTRAPGFVLPSPPPRQHRVFSREEIAAIVRAARAERRCRDHLPLFVLLATYTGKRSEAIRTLQWRPNTERDGWIDVASGMIHWGYSGTKKRRGEPTPIPRPVIGILRARARRGGKYVLTTGRTRKDRASGRFNHSWDSALRRAGVEPGRMHDLRHTAASVMLANGVEPWLAAQYLGMTVETLTRVYGHMIPGALRRAVDAVVRKA